MEIESRYLVTHDGVYEPYLGTSIFLSDCKAVIPTVFEIDGIEYVIWQTCVQGSYFFQDDVTSWSFNGGSE